MIKIIAGFTLTLLLIPMAFASGGPTLGDIANEALDDVRKQRVALINVNHAYISCNFAIPCAYEKIVHYEKEEKNAMAKEVYSDVIKAINPNLPKFQAFEKQCGMSVPLNKMRDVLVGCLTSLNDNMEQNDALTNYEEKCLIPNLTTLAVEGNMFALERIYALLPRAQANEIAEKSFPNVSDSAMSEYSECVKLLR